MHAAGDRPKHLDLVALCKFFEKKYFLYLKY